MPIPPDAMLRKRKPTPCPHPAEEPGLAVLGVVTSGADVAVVAAAVDQRADAAGEADALAEADAGVEVVVELAVEPPRVARRPGEIARSVDEHARARKSDALALVLSVIDVASAVVLQGARTPRRRSPGSTSARRTRRPRVVQRMPTPPSAPPSLNGDVAEYVSFPDQSIVMQTGLIEVRAPRAVEPVVVAREVEAERHSGSCGACCRVPRSRCVRRACPWR